MLLPTSIFRFFLFSATLLLLFSCSPKQQSAEQTEQDFTRFVDPFIGTDGIVHTFPGATVPYSMIQLSPDGDTKGWNWCSGYHYSDENIKGFSHTHLSGTGWADLGDILVTATTGEIQLNSGPKAAPDSGYRSRISHEQESASPGYYQVKLLDYGVNAELTTSDRIGFHRYTFPATEQAHILIDPTNIIFGKAKETHVELVGKDRIEGHCHSAGWGGERSIYFVAQLSRPWDAAGVGVKREVSTDPSATGADAKAWTTFNTSEGEAIELKMAISAVSLEGARKNMAAEGEGTNFEQARAAARHAWNRELSKIEISGCSEDMYKMIYTGLYHAMIDPNISMDVDGGYVAMGKAQKAEGFVNYSTFSTWDTHRAVHPLLTMIDETRTADFVKSLVSRHQQGDHLPIWELCGYDNRCMVGYPSVAVIADAVLKDIQGIDAEAAYAAIRDIAFHPKPTDIGNPGGLEEYLELGYVSADIPKSVSKSMEFSYYDWCIARVAEKLGKTEDMALFDQRSKNFLRHYNPEQQLFWPIDREGKFLEGIDLTDWESLKQHYVSGNIWAYSYFYPHANEDVIELMGGKEAFAANLDKLFAEPLEMAGEQHVDISGFIGHYGHGDEPGHQIPYLYNYVDQPHKTQQKVQEVMETMYSTDYDGMINNDDCGQMSAWYIFSAIGFYPVCPGDLRYALGAPSIGETTLHLHNGKSFTVKATGLSDTKRFVQSIKLNGQPLEGLFLRHEDIMAGGELEFVMGEKQG